MRPEDEFPRIYEVRLSEPAEAELEAGYLRLSRFSLDAAERWNEGILTACRSLSELPRRYPRTSHEDQNGPETRRMLFRSSNIAYWILYVVFEETEDNPAFVRILHLRHHSIASSERENERG